jgi:hypothetical protein
MQEDVMVTSDDVAFQGHSVQPDVQAQFDGDGKCKTCSRCFTTQTFQFVVVVHITSAAASTTTIIITL